MMNGKIYIFILLGFCSIELLLGSASADDLDVKTERNISVLIVGGGLAGLTAAVQLTNIPGMQVHVTHDSSRLGDDFEDVELTLNHTTYKLSKVHTAFSSSSNATLTLMDYLKLRPNLILEDSTTLKFKNYASHKVSYKDSYLSILNYARSSQNCYSIFSLPGVFVRMRRIRDFKFNKDIKKLQSVSFLNYLNNLGIKSPEYDCLLAPSLSTTGYNASTISALEAMTRIWSNYLQGSNHESLKNYQYVRNSTKTSTILEAILNKLKLAGVTFQTNYQVKSFYADGENGIILADNANREKTYDFVVIANKPNNAASLLKKTAEMYTGEMDFAMPLIEMANQLTSLKDSPDRKVIKVILNKKVDPKTAPRMIVSGYQYINSVVQLNHYHAALNNITRTIKGSILELQVNNLPKNKSLPWTTIYDELIKIFPELNGSKVLNKTESMLSSSRSLEINQEQNRLLVDSAIKKGINNLLFANDWVATPGYAAVEIERPIYLGLNAAYKILSHLQELDE